MTDLNHGILGIDISKLKFDVALMIAGKVKKTHILSSDEQNSTSQNALYSTIV